MFLLYYNYFNLIIDAGTKKLFLILKSHLNDYLLYPFLDLNRLTKIRY